MSLKGLADATKSSPRTDPSVAPVTVADRAGREHVLRFRRPRVADLQPPRAAIERFEAMDAVLTPAEVFETWLLAASYVPEQGDGEINPIDLFVEIRQADDLLFADLLKGFSDRFREFGDWISARAARVGNAVGEPSETASASGSGASPTASDGSRENSPT